MTEPMYCRDGKCSYAYEHLRPYEHLELIDEIERDLIYYNLRI